MCQNELQAVHRKIQVLQTVEGTGVRPLALLLWGFESLSLIVQVTLIFALLVIDFRGL